jgi:hypothetical protein
LLCAACVERALEANEAPPEETRAHLRQALLALVFGLVAWGMALLAMVLVVAGMTGGDGGPGFVAVGLGGLLLLASPLPSLLGVGQGAAAIRARGDHLILATTGLLLSGLHAGAVIGLFLFSVWEN